MPGGRRGALSVGLACLRDTTDQNDGSVLRRRSDEAPHARPRLDGYESQPMWMWSAWKVFVNTPG